MTVAGDEVSLAVQCPTGFVDNIELFVGDLMSGGVWRIEPTTIFIDAEDIVHCTVRSSDNRGIEYFIAANADLDSDLDGVTDARELYVYKTGPNDSDSDDDGTYDGAEVDIGTDPNDRDSFPANVSGMILYVGSQTGQVWIVAVTTSNSWSADYSDDISIPGPYSITNLPNNTDYWLKAYRDSDGNGTLDFNEASGYYTNNPVYLTNDVADINMVLTDPIIDMDKDGMPDSWEEELVNADANDNIEKAAHLLPGDDFDGDGVSNKDEYNYGTDASSSADFPPLIGFDIPVQTVSEAITDITACVTVTLSAPAASAAQGRVYVDRGTATGNSVDYTFTSQTVSFSPGETSKQVNVIIMCDENDMVLEPRESVLFMLDQISGPVVAGANDRHLVYIKEFATDTDADGLPDWWESQYFGGATNGVASEDEEPDGWDNLTEYLRGGNPTNAWIPDTNNVLQLQLITPLRGMD
jgi:hypothetical protein